MDTYFSGRLLAQDLTEFTGTDGQPVKYFTYVIKNDTGGILNINSTKDFADFVDKRCVFTLTLRAELKLYKVSLGGCREFPTDAETPMEAVIT